MRIAGVRPAYRVEDLGQWRVNAGLKAHATTGPRDGHSFLLSTNDDGLRTDVKPARTPRMQRIALVGDSTVFGWGVDDGQTIAEGVSEGMGPGFEVLNAGQPGYSTTMMAWFFGEVLHRYQPDMTVVFVPMHDTNLVLVSDREVLNGGATAMAKIRVLLARQSRIYELLRGVLFESTDRAWLLPDQQADEPRVQRVSDLERSQALDDMQALMAPWGGKLAVGFLPFKGDIEDGGRMLRPTQGWAEAYAKARAIPFVDVRTCCAGETGLVLADDPGHLTRDGNFAAGRAIARKLIASGFGEQE